jgi:hypothetical protein
MITENNIKRLDNIVSKYAMQDYLRANPNTPAERRKRMRKMLKGESAHNSYSLSLETNQAREMLHLAHKKNITAEEENTIKSYLLKKKMIEDM